MGDYRAEMKRGPGGPLQPCFFGFIRVRTRTIGCCTLAREAFSASLIRMPLGNEETGPRQLDKTVQVA